MLFRSWEQWDLFSDQALYEKRRRVDAAVDNIRERYGFYSLQRGMMLQDPQLSELNAREEHTVHPHGFF